MKRLIQVLWVVASVAVIAQLANSIHDLSKRGDVVAQTQDRLQKVRDENIALKEQAAYVESPAFVEQQARDKLNLARKGEVVALVPHEELSPTPPVEAEDKANWQLWMEAFRLRL